MRIRNEYQNFFKRECFTHQITLPPSPITERTVVQCLDEIEFKLNKTFLKSSFPKYKPTDRFRFFIFPEDKNINLQHFHILLYSPRNRDKEFNVDKCIACKFREEPYFQTCSHCTTRVLYELIEKQVPVIAHTLYSMRTRKKSEDDFTKKFIRTMKDVRITISDETDDYSSIYATKKQHFSYENADSYLVC
jgi:hypothetical protein